MSEVAAIEYKVLVGESLISDKQLNDLGRERWKLITIVVGSDLQYYIYLSREKAGE